ncbi:MAG: LysR family transcriptional regulator [Methylobacteriaceae bacterium]|nr:LysR family transcriptional regulator [Methylobacteriaceae bacterium]
MAQSSRVPSDRHPAPPLAHLEAVREVARRGSLSAAAEALDVTAGAVSRRVAAVEAWLGAALFERHGRGMRPNPDGQRFLSRLEEAFGLIQAAADPWRGRRGSDVVRISVVPSFARFWLLDRLRALELGPADGRMPLRIEIAVEHRHADVEGGEVDLAIRYGRGSWPGLEARPLLPERLAPVARADLAAALGPDPAPARLLAHPLLADSDAVGWRVWFAQAGLARFRPRPQDRRFEDYGLVLAAAEAGLGIALARLPFAAEAVRRAGLVRLGRLEAPSPLASYLVMRPREARPATLALADRLAQAAAT